MFNFIQEFDKTIIYAVQEMRSPLMDQLMLGISDKNNWIVVFIFILLVSIFKYRLKGLKFVIFLALLFGVVDITSAKIFKPYFERLRPCHVFDIETLVGCGGRYGFWSNHAANMFALFHFMILVFRKNILFYLLYIIPVLAAFSRIYLVKHYFTDVVAGGIYGIIWATLFYKIYSLGKKKS